MGGPKIDLPLDADISTNKDTATVNIGTVGKAKQVVGEVVDTEVISRDLEKVSGQAVATAAAQPKTKKIATGVVGRTGQQIAEVHEQEMLERDLNKVSGESVHVAAGVSTKAHVPTGKIDQATRQVGEVVETKTKERDVETLMGAPATATEHKTHVEGVETHTTARNLNRAHNLKTSRELNGSQEIAPM